ncbi:aldose 1-epimerase [Faunimonas pinastri]|uniref:Aldose 1-epimerase n=1 Tax=Faunimonas pinastri TaxID=1855383 RepID=A0A1H9LKV7_9HYPH|nr:aldose 1-epimerase [Faunimonas pinastri]SER12142.1 aldose 1-epimerase [Faunimonas pinastri]
MTSITLAGDGFDAAISTAGGIITRLRWSAAGTSIPLLRDAPDDATALQSACYPLVPFANRVAGNRFSFEGRSYAFQPNTDWDRHYLHGEGWLDEWQVVAQDERSLTLGFAHCGGGTPYAYEATQRFAIEDGALVLSLSVTNRGESTLPFGLGWHPYFAMTPQTTLKAPAAKFWTEVEGWLPGEATDIPEELDFSRPRGLPHHWVNNGFEDWSGVAEITWPEHSARLAMRADPIFRHAFVFVSDTGFDPGYKRDYFCFEPMTHLANGHNLEGLGGLKPLAPAETLSGSVRLKPELLG